MDTPPSWFSSALAMAACIGLLVALFLGWITVYFTAVRYRPVQSLAQASQGGHATNVITGLALGMKSVALPVLVVVTGILAANAVGGLYAIATATVAMLAMALKPS